VSGGLAAADIVQRLDLTAHPEGGFYRETFRDDAADETGRARSTLIYFLLAEGQVSAWHRVDATEIWLWHAGAPLELSIRSEDGVVQTVALGPNIARSERPQAVVPAHAWQSARSRGAWTLVSCVVAPGFEFEGFELEADG
jgi:predicted cupin superfamily sugar epimerase